MGIPVHYHKDVKLAFGDYVEAYEGTTKILCPHSSACIALYPANNAAGSRQLFKIDMHTRVRRSNMVKLITGELIIQAMNNIAAEKGQSAMEPVRQRLEEIVESQKSASMRDDEVQAEDEEPMNGQQGAIEDSIEEDDGEEELASTDDIEEMAEGAEAGAITTRSGSRFLVVTKISRKELQNQEVAKAIREQIRRLFADLKVLRMVRRASIKAGTKILKSDMFVVAKHLASGEFDKMKARLVGDGRD